MLLGAVSSCSLDPTRRAQEAKIAALEAENQALSEEAARLRAELKKQQAKVDALTEQLASARDDATREKLETEIEKQKRLAQDPLNVRH